MTDQPPILGQGAATGDVAARKPPGGSPALRGRGTGSQIAGRFETLTRAPADDGWDLPEDPPSQPQTTVTAEQAREILSWNRSPDLPFDRAINAYRGCEHGCIYCYARASHAWLNLSPGLDFETRLFYKANAAERLEATLRRPGYRCAPINLGANTDPYQPVEARLGITRQILEVLWRYRHPVTLVTKGAALMRRDLDLLTALADQRLVRVGISLTTLDDTLKRRLEPRTASPASRLRLMRLLSDAGVPVTAMIAPVIPVLTDPEMEALLSAAREAGASRATWGLLRLPHEVAPLFAEWLQEHEPGKAEHILRRVREAHGGRDNDSRFGIRQRGSGAFAEVLQQRFRLACRRLGYENALGGTASVGPDTDLDVHAFRIPPDSGPGADGQLSLF